jgi:peptidyl-dipeptidase Dcp
MNEAVVDVAANDNPLLEDWSGAFGVPPFTRIEPRHFLPAFARAFADHSSEVAAIAAHQAAPTFANTIDALETAGAALTRVSNVFDLLASADTNDDILEIERELAPLEAQHWNRILMDEALFRRVDRLYRSRDELGLTPEQARVLERYHAMFTRAGAALEAAAKARLAAINERLAALATDFGQNVLADEQASMLELDGEADLEGLPDFVRSAARAAATERGLEGKHIITTARSSVEPFLQFSARRDLREKIFRAWIARGDGGGATDNKAVIAEMAALRAERARLLGFPSFAHYRLDDAMAKTPAAVRALLDRVWAPALKHALVDHDAF